MKKKDSLLNFLKNEKLDKKSLSELNSTVRNYPNLDYPETNVSYYGNLETLYSLYNLSKTLSKKRNKDAKKLSEDVLVVFNAAGRRTFRRTVGSSKSVGFLSISSKTGGSETISRRYTAEDVRIIIARSPELSELKSVILKKFRRSVRTRRDFKRFLLDLGYEVVNRRGDDVTVRTAQFNCSSITASAWESPRELRKTIRDPSQFLDSVVVSITPSERNMLDAFSKMVNSLFKKGELKLSLTTLASLFKKGLLDPIKGKLKTFKITLSDAIKAEGSNVPVLDLWDAGVVEITG